ncbi:MAG: inositol-3-phosphate synthase, partial [Solirubrobacteraceae bacterium]
GIVIDAVRLLKLALNHGLSGQLDGPSSYLMKSPHTQRPDADARELTEAFIKKYARKPVEAKTKARAAAKA